MAHVDRVTNSYLDAYQLQVIFAGRVLKDDQQQLKDIFKLASLCKRAPIGFLNH
jgi:hypothetical protein